MNQQSILHQHALQIIENSGEFDAEYYCKSYPDVAKSGINPIAHYVYFGADENRNPNPNFQTKLYREQAGVPKKNNPFAFYLASKMKDITEAKKSAISKHLKEPTDLSLLIRSEIFDKEFYHTRYPGSLNSGVYKEIGEEYGAHAHYLKHSFKEGQNPCELFDNRYYLSTYKDVASTGTNPLIHYIQHGWKELRNPSKKFDTAWYWLVHQNGDTGCLNPLTHFYKLGKDLDLSTKPSSPTDFKALAVVVENLDANDLDTSTLLRIAQYSRDHGQTEIAEGVYLKIIRNNPECVDTYKLLASLQADKGAWWQAIETLASAIDLEPTDALTHFKLGEAYEKMNQFDKAERSFANAIKLDHSNHIWHYRHGYVLRKIGKLNQATTEFSIALKLNPDSKFKHVGVGLYDQDRGYWPDAVESYKFQLRKQSRSAEIHFRLGVAFMHCYEWEQAKSSLENAIGLQFENADWHYKLASVNERLGNYSAAEQMYRSALSIESTLTSDLHYRLGYCLFKQNKFEECAQHFYSWQQASRPDLLDHNESLRSNHPDSYLDSIKKSSALTKIVRTISNDSDNYAALGDALQAELEWEKAAEAYASAILRANSFSPDLLLKHATALFKLERFEEASQAYIDTKLFREIFPNEPQSPKKQIKITQRMMYAGYLAYPIKEKTIVYESFLASTMSCNPLAIFKKLIHDPAYQDWLHVWVLNDEDLIPDEFNRIDNVVYIKRQSDAYIHYLATASHLINNVTFPEWFIRRPEQSYLNTWHGTPIKHLGKDIKDDFMAHKNVSRNFLHASHLLSPNDHTTSIMLDRYDIRGIYTGKFAQTGYPRIDVTVNASLTDKKTTLQSLFLRDDLPVVLYAPTWRGAHGHAEVDSIQIENDLLELATLPCQIVFRGHHFSEAAIKKLNLPVTIADQSIDTGELLSIVDLLVTDYSSIFFDFLPVKKPIVFYTYDLEEYKKERGLYFNFEEMPGPLCSTIEETKSSIISLLDNYEVSQKHIQAITKFCPLEDGSSTFRAIEFFLKDNNTFNVEVSDSSKPSLLIYPGTFVPNGITSSCLNLLNNIPEDDYNLSIVIDPVAVSASEERLHKYSKLPSHINTVARVGQMVLTPEESLILDRFNTHRHLENAEMWNILENLYKREFSRVLGASKFDSIINFEGYSYFWSSLLGLGKPSNENAIIYLHNDMHSEWKVRHPYLRGIFALYRYYESLVSVSETMKNINLRNLSAYRDLSEDKFKFCINTINPEEILTRASLPMDPDLDAWVGDSKLLLTLGRLSPEKDQAKLVRAFDKVAAKYSNLKLLILGDGPLKSYLESLINELGLSQRIMLGGLRENPFPALKRADCFILPSNHEGQPMVLLESLALGKAIIASDIDGNRGVLKDGYGELVPNDIDGLVAGIKKFMNRKLRHKEFDAETYMASAIAMFKSNLTTSDIPQGAFENESA